MVSVIINQINCNCEFIDDHVAIVIISIIVVEVVKSFDLIMKRRNW